MINWTDKHYNFLVPPLMMPPYNITKQFAFVYVGLENLTMGCTKLYVGRLEFRFELPHPMTIFPRPTIT
jgi:hypothetical protein